MTWQCRNVRVSTHLWNRNPPKPVIGPTKYCAKHIYKLTLYRTYSQKLIWSARVSTFYFDMFASNSNEVSRK